MCVFFNIVFSCHQYFTSSYESKYNFINIDRCNVLARMRAYVTSLIDRCNVLARIYESKYNFFGSSSSSTSRCSISSI